MKTLPSELLEDPEDEIVALVHHLHEIQERLRELTEGRVDAVTDSDGHSYLLREAQDKLRQSEMAQRRLAETQMVILNALPAHIALIDSAGVILAVNEAWRHFATANVLHSPDFCLGQNYLEVCERAVGDCSREANVASAGIRRVLRGDVKEFAIEYPCHSPDEVRWFRLMATPVRDDRLAGAVVMHVDISERKRVEEQLAANEALLREFIRHTPAAIAMLDTQMRYVEASEQWVHDYRLIEQEIIGKSHYEIFPEVPQRWKDIHQRVLAGAVERCDEDVFPRADGSVDWLRWEARPWQGAGGEIGGIIFFTQIITERKRAEQALRESNEKFHQLADNITDAFWIRSPDLHEVQYVSPAFAKIWGRPVEILYSNPHQWVEFIFPEDRERVLEAFAALKGDAPSLDIEYRIVRPEGEIRWIRVRGFQIRNAAGELIRHAGIATDITEHKAVEQALRTSEERFRLLSKATNDAIWDWDLTRNALWWNDGFETLFGFDRAAVEPSVDSRLNRIHPDDKDAIVADLHRALDGDAESWVGEYRYHRKDGSYAHVLDRGHIIRNAEGKAVRMIGGMTDLTERIESEQRIAEQAALIDEAPDAIIVRDLEHRIAFWSKGAERTFGWTFAEVQGRPLRELLQVDPGIFAEADRKVREAGEWSGEIHKRTKGGNVLTLDARWSLVRDGHGEPRSILSIDTDITERKKLEQQFFRAQRMESIGTLAGGIAHDLNNVLGPIIMSLDLLKLRLPDKETHEVLEIIGSSAQRGADMVRQVLSFARGVEGRRMEVQVKHLIKDIEKIAQDTFSKHIQIRTNLPSDIWTVSGDPTQLHQVLLNLCVNARDAMPDGGTLAITAENVAIDEQYAGLNSEAKPGSYVFLQVEDSGTGIPPDVVEKIFDPFFTTKELGKGTGLGLSTTLAIVKSHGGFIRVCSEPGKGTKFKVYLPAQTEPSAEAVAEIAAQMPRGNGELILVVDDEAPVRQITKQTLEAFGYNVILATNGAEALAAYASRGAEIAVVLTDMMMPVMDGPATIQVLLRLNPDVPIIAASGLSAGSHDAQVARLGVRHFLPKPYTAETLLKVLREILTEKR